MKKLLILCCTSLLITMYSTAQPCNIKPQFNSLTQTINCNTNMYTLSQSIITNIPNSPWASVNWTTQTTQPYVSVLPNTTGVYYAYFTDANNACGILSDPVYFTNTCDCSTLTNAQGNVQINSDINNKNYWFTTLHITQNITIYGNCNFVGVRFYIEPNVTISIDANAVVDCQFVHMTCCSGMWRGINVMPGGKLSVGSDPDWFNVIEDAIVGISYNFQSPYTFYAPQPLLKVVGTIFNRCETGISIKNFHQNTAGSSMPFYITNCAFTSRELPNQEGSTGGNFVCSFPTLSYDAVWNGFATIPDTYNAPYCNSKGCPSPDNTPKAFLHTGTYSEKPRFGISISNCARNSGEYICLGNNHQGNNSVRGFLLFDNVDVGIDITNSAVWVTNSVFQKKHANSSKGIGIHARYYDGSGIIDPLPKEKSKLVVSNTNLNGTPSIIPNSFFDLKNAIITDAVNQVAINGCNIRSSQSSTNAANPYGQNGISVNDNESSSISITNNYIYNINKPINYRNMAGYNGVQNNVTISNNIIAAQLPTAVSTGNEFVNTAINLQGSNFNITNDATPLLCNTNSITDAYQGIIATAFNGKTIECKDNTVQLTLAPLNAGSLIEQTGIKWEGNRSNNAVATNIENNTIIGTTASTKVTGIKASLTTGTQIHCNHVASCQNGFKFYGNCPQMQFTDNHIAATNQNGVYLDQAIIGTQGNDGSTNAADACTSNNDWQQDATTWQSNNQNMIYNNLTVPTDAQFVIKGTGKFNPSYGGNATYAQQNYYVGNGLLLATMPDGVNCTRCFGAPQRIKTIIEILDEIAAGTVLLPDDDAQKRLEVMQQQVYDLVKANPQLAANSINLQQFIYDNQWQSLDFIYYLGYFAAQGNMNMVNSILNYWLPNQNDLDDNVRIYYQWLIAMYNDPIYTPNLTEVQAYASKCPLKNGTVIYAIRNLYNALTKEINSFEDNCDATNTQARGIKPTATQMIRLKQPKAKQSIGKIENKLILYPNPVINSLKVMNNNNIVKLEIVNTLGITVMQQNTSNTNIVELNVTHLPNGVYLLRAFDSNGKVFNNKFIKQ